MRRSVLIGVLCAEAARKELKAVKLHPPEVILNHYVKQLERIEREEAEEVEEDYS